MGFKLRSSGLPFKEMGSSPAKQNDLTKETDNTRDNSEQTKKKSNASFEGNIMTNTETGDTYNLKTGETTKNKKPKAEPRRKKSADEVRRLQKSATPYKESPAKQIKEVKGTSIFGKSPKDFVVDVAKNVTGYNAVKGIYDKISGSKTELTNNKSSKNSVSKGASEAVSEAVTKGLVEGGKMGLMKKKGKLVKDSMKKVAKPVEKKYMKVTKDLKMKPPYKKPVGPRAN
jgi:hypothetical protein